MGSVDKCSCHFPAVTNSETEHAHPTKTGDFQYPANPTPATGVAVNLPPVATTPTAEYAFPVLEEHKETAGPKDVKVTLPNKARLTPLSIMVCDTISAVRSRMLLKVLFDPGSTTTFISRKCLPRHCKPCPAARNRSVNTLAGSCTANEVVVLRAIRLPELDKNRVVDQHEALVFDGEIRYDLIFRCQLPHEDRHRHKVQLRNHRMVRQRTANAGSKVLRPRRLPRHGRIA